MRLYFNFDVEYDFNREGDFDYELDEIKQEVTVKAIDILESILDRYDVDDFVSFDFDIYNGLCWIEFSDVNNKDSFVAQLKDFQKELESFEYSSSFTSYGEQISKAYDGGYYYDPPEYEEFEVEVKVNFEIKDPTVKVESKG